MPQDLKSPAALYTKAILFLLLGTLAAGGVFLEHPTARTLCFLLLAIWAFARAYYFAFYVLHHYVDPTFNYAGLTALARYILTKRPR